MVSHLNVGGQEFFNQNVGEGHHFFGEKIPKFPSPPPQEKTYHPLVAIVFTFEQERSFCSRQHDTFIVAISKCSNMDASSETQGFKGEADGRETGRKRRGRGPFPPPFLSPSFPCFSRSHFLPPPSPLKPWVSEGDMDVIQKIVYVNEETGFSVVMLHFPTFPDFKDLIFF